MDPYHQQQRLINEVIYLHSLWHQGPPTPPQTRPHPHPYPYFTPPPLSNDPSSTGLLHYYSNHAQFEQERIKRKRNEGDDERRLSPDKEWPCKPISAEPPATTSDWNTAWPKLNSEPLLVSAGEKAKLAANQAQFKALKVTKDYFFTSDDENDSDDDDAGFMEEDDDGCEEQVFFVKLFEENNELRDYCSNNYQNGEFFCLVCGGLGKKLARKKYKGCIALVQHSISIARTKKRRAHRAYGKAICKVLGWDIDNLSRIVAAMAENRELPLDTAEQGDVENDGDASASVGGENTDGLLVLESKDGSIDVTNSVEGQAQAIIDEAKDAFTALDYKEGSVDASASAEGDAERCKDNAVANVQEGTEDSSMILANKDAPVDTCNCGILPTSQTASIASKTVDDDNLTVPVVVEGKETEKLDHHVAIIDEEYKDGTTALECKEGSTDVTTLGPGDAGCNNKGNQENSQTAASVPKTADDYNLTAPVVVEGKETEMLDHPVEPCKDGCIVSDEGKDALLHDLAKVDAAS